MERQIYYTRNLVLSLLHQHQLECDLRRHNERDGAGRKSQAVLRKLEVLEKRIGRLVGERLR